MASESGTVVAVQETRFRFVTYDGRVKLFLLASQCEVETQDLASLVHEPMLVRVTYEPASGLVAAVATRVEYDL